MLLSVHSHQREKQYYMFHPSLPPSKTIPLSLRQRFYWPKEIPSQQPAFKVYWQPLDYRNCSFVKNFLKVLKIYLLNLKKVSILLAQDWIMTKATWQEKRDTVELHNSVGGPWVCRILISIFFFSWIECKEQLWG